MIKYNRDVKEIMAKNICIGIAKFYILKKLNLKPEKGGIL